MVKDYPCCAVSAWGWTRVCCSGCAASACASVYFSAEYYNFVPSSRFSFRVPLSGI